MEAGHGGTAARCRRSGRGRCEALPPPARRAFVAQEAERRGLRRCDPGKGAGPPMGTERLLVEGSSGAGCRTAAAR